MRFSGLILCSNVALLIAALPAAVSATVANSGTVIAAAYAEATGGIPDNQFIIDTAAGLPTSLSAVIVAQSSAEGNGTVESRTAAAATWASADAGSIRLQQERSFSTDPGIGGAQDNGVSDNWVYDFTATETGAFSLDYSVAFAPAAPGNSPFGFTGWTLAVNGGFVASLEDFSVPVATGTASFRVLAGRDYVVTLSNFTNISGGVSAFNSGSVTGLFNWTITAVPEPASWALMIAGFGMAGVALRRRRAFATA